MTTTEHPMVVGVFQDHTKAAQAIDELHSAGFLDHRIRMKQTATASGLLDHLVSSLTGFEAESKTLPDELMDKGMPEGEAHYYQEEFEAGHSIVIIEAYEHQQEARAILQRNGAYDVSWAGTSHSPYELAEGASIIPVLEEVLQAHKQMVQIGEVVLRKKVVTEKKTITVPVRHEELIIEHLPASSLSSDQPLQAGETLDEALKDGGKFKIVLHEEQVRVEKYPVEKEEIFISKRLIEETKHFSDTVKREEVRIEQLGNVHVQEHNGNPVSD